MPEPNKDVLRKEEKGKETKKEGKKEGRKKGREGETEERL